MSNRRQNSTDLWSCELCLMYTFVLVDVVISGAILMVGVDALSTIRTLERKLDRRPSLADALGRYVAIVMAIQGFTLLVVLYSIYYWHLLHRKLALVNGYVGSHTSSWWAQFMSVFLMAMGYLFQYGAFGLSYSFSDVTANVPLHPKREGGTYGFLEADRDALRDELHSVTWMLAAGILTKTCKLMLGHGWAITATHISADKASQPAAYSTTQEMDDVE